MVLPYYLGKTIAESHVFTATPASLAAWKVKTMIGRKAAELDTATSALTLDDGSTVEYDDCLIATGSRARGRRCRALTAPASTASGRSTRPARSSRA